MPRYHQSLRTALLWLIWFSLVPLLPAQQPFVGAKREFRGVWIATVKNYDWPLKPTMSTQQQQDSLRALLDDFAAARFNAIVFQVRPECDALYLSSIEPWSYWLTGSQGTGPSPAYDPLQFALDEAHKRGMELHAWVNPYRAYREDNTYPRHPTHVTQQHPDWVITCPDGYRFLDPGLPQVRDHVARVVADIVRRYNVDGIHFDDYFYPYPEHNFTKQDSLTWVANRRGFSWDSVAFWRRDNTNLLMRQVYDSITAIKPWVKFGASPFGIWRSNVPSGITGLSAYDDIYCDALAWLQGGYVDYIVPQLYWAFGGAQDYGTLQPWWASQRNGRHFYTGNADYKILQSGWPADEINNQIRYNQSVGNAQGSVQFRAYNLRGNDGGIVDLLKADAFRYPSLVPVMDWKETTPPNAPGNLQMTFNSALTAYELQWQAPGIAADGDSASRYAVYRFRTPTPMPGDLLNPRNILSLSGDTKVIPVARIDSADVQYSYAVSALDKNNNESALSAPVTVTATLTAPALVSPADGEQHFARNAQASWKRPPGATLFRFQLDSTGTFAALGLLINRTTQDTSIVPSGLQTLKTYHWRVIAGSQLAESPVSATRSFKTSWPVPPTLVYPVAARGVPRNPTFVWNSTGGTSYRIHVYDYITGDTVVNATATDTTLKCPVLLTASRTHTWKVSAASQYGESDWSALVSFQTGTTVLDVTTPGLPDRVELAQNFPNPFNPATVIRYALPTTQQVKLAVYDVLGREVRVLVEGLAQPGEYRVQFDAGSLAGGVYFYRLQTDGFVETKKFMLLK
jgi:uncharacterized lipoprotein YddW (UPF0748 family)